MEAKGGCHPPGVFAALVALRQCERAKTVLQHLVLHYGGASADCQAKLLELIDRDPILQVGGLCWL